MPDTICIVDDEPAILNTLSSILEDEGYQVTIAKTGREALGVIQQEPPDVVLLDIWIPEFDGLEVLKRVREQFPNMMVIMMSGHGSVETGVKAMKLGAYDYLEKPLDLEKVPILVRNALDKRKLKACPEPPLQAQSISLCDQGVVQDAMICWLLRWSERQYQSEDEALHACGVRFVRALLQKHGTCKAKSKRLEIYQQESGIDVLARINNKHVLLIESKTNTRDHNEQLTRYYNAVIER